MVQKSAVHKLVLMENSYIQDFGAPANDAEHDENQKGGLRRQLKNRYNFHALNIAENAV